MKKFLTLIASMTALIASAEPVPLKSGRKGSLAYSTHRGYRKVPRYASATTDQKLDAALAKANVACEQPLC